MQAVVVERKRVDVVSVFKRSQTRARHRCIDRDGLGKRRTGTRQRRLDFSDFCTEASAKREGLVRRGDRFFPPISKSMEITQLGP